MDQAKEDAQRILEASADWLEGHGWIRGRFYAKADGHPTTSQKAERACLLGSLFIGEQKVFPRTSRRSRAAEAIAQTCLGEEIARRTSESSYIGPTLWNDAYAKSKAQVVSVLRRAAKACHATTS